MAQINVIVLTGTLVADAALNGEKGLFKLQVNERIYRNGENVVESTIFECCIENENMAKAVVPALKERSKVNVIGEIAQRISTQDGDEVSVRNIIRVSKVTAGDLNVAIVSGNCGRDSQLRYTQQGVAVVDNSLAVDTYRPSQEDETVWVRITIWAKRAEGIVNSLKKGTNLFITGRYMNSSGYIGNDGTPRASVEIWPTNLAFGRRGNNESGSDITDPLFDSADELPGDDKLNIPF